MKMVRRQTWDWTPSRSLILVGAVIGMGFLSEGRAGGAPPGAQAAGAAPAVPGEGIAARYPGDAGIKNDPAVIFADDFESWGENGTQPPLRTWEMHKNPVSRTRVVPAKVTTPGLFGPGAHVLEVACWKREPEGGSTGGLALKLGNYNHAKEGLGDGYDEVYVRYYIKLDEDYHNVANHGSNLGGRDATRNSYWVGQAGMFDVGAVNYFYSGLQPYPNGKAKDPNVRDWEFGFYGYHLDKPDAWGERFKAEKQILVRAGQWHCLERHMKLNSIDTDAPPPAPTPASTAPVEKPKTPAEKQARYKQALGERDRLNTNARRDGIEELWVDGQLTIRQAVRFRRNPSLRITYFTLENYYHGLPPEYTSEHPIKVYYDNVVIARTYIGPLHGSAPRSAEK